MATRGRKPKPHGLKVLQGTAKGDPPEVSFPEPEEGSPPLWLTDPDALEAWYRLYDLLSANRILTQGDLDLLAQLCAWQGKVIMIYRSGGTPAASMIQQLRTFYNECGLTPASRSRVKPANKGEQSNPFAKLVSNK